MNGLIRVLVVDDSPSFRRLLAGLLGAYPDIEIVGQAADGIEAIEAAIQLRPDVITMDANMPRMNGLDAVKQIMDRAPTRILVMASVARRSQVDLTFEAVENGALEVIAKPDIANADQLAHWARRARETVVLMAEIPVIRRATEQSEHQISNEVRAVGIASSAGGPVALAKIFSKLEPVSVPIFVAQHMASGFTSGLIRFLQRASSLPVEEAVAGQRPQGGRIYIAPDTAHMVLDRIGRFHIEATTDSMFPCADRLLVSMASFYGAATLALVLTGMGEDGAKGLLAIQQAGGSTAVQDQSSSMVWGMPGAASALGAASATLAVDAIAPFINARCGAAGWVK